MKAPSCLNLFADEILRRKRQGYTQKMLLIFLEQQHKIIVRQSTLSRWLSLHEIESELPPDDEFDLYQKRANLSRQQRNYRQKLATYKGQIEHLRDSGRSLGQIQADLNRRGVRASIRSIRRALGAK